MPWTGRGIFYPSLSDTVLPASRDLKDMASTTDEAIGRARWDQGILSDGTDLNTVTREGGYRIEKYSTALSLINRPALSAAVNRAKLSVYGEGSDTVVQVWRTASAVGTDTPIMQRVRDNGGTWSAWRRIDGGPAALTESDRLDNLTQSGSYVVPTYKVASAVMPQPYQVPIAVNPAIVRVEAGPGVTVMQEWVTVQTDSTLKPILRRFKLHDGTWTAFESVRAASGSDVGASSASAAEVAEMTRVTTNRALSLQITDRQNLPVWAWSAPSADAPLTVPTHEGSGSVTHPSVRYVEGGWNGYPYWMAFTPYPNGSEKHEDPNIVASTDGLTWVVPNGLVNPLDDQVGKPSPYNSDTHLTWGPNGEMVCLWRMVDRPNGGQEVLKWRTSTDGVTWTEAREIYRIPLGLPYSSFVAPSLHWMGDKWRLYGVSTNPIPNKMVYFETSDRVPTTASWSEPVTCSVGPQFPDRDWWHIDIQPDPDGGWYGTMNDVRRGKAGVDGHLYLMRSADGLEWEVSPVPLVPQIGATHNSLYKSSVLARGSGPGRAYDVWYAAFHTSNRDHRLSFTTATVDGVVPHSS